MKFSARQLPATAGGSSLRFRQEIVIELDTEDCIIGIDDGKVYILTEPAIGVDTARLKRALAELELCLEGVSQP